MTTIAVTGYEGRLGSVLVSQFGCVPLVCDITKPDEIKSAIVDVDPDVIINCAAITSVDACENEEFYLPQVIPVNIHGVANVHTSMLEVAKKSCWMVQISTDYIFAGKRGPYDERYKQKQDDLPTQKMSYGFSKWAAEVTMWGYPRVMTVRTTGLFGSPDHDDFVTCVTKHLSTSDKPFLASKNLQGNQTYVPFLARDLVQMANMPSPPALLHLASKDVMTRYEFALAIASMFDLDKSKIEPVLSSQVPGWIAERPVHGGLRTVLSRKLGFKPYTILDGLKALHEQR